MSQQPPQYTSSIWFEEAPQNNPFASQQAYIHGFNLCQEILPNASWSELIYLLFKSERPTSSEAKLFEKLALLIANPGFRDNGVRAAMNAGVGGSTAAACIIAAVGVSAGQFGGAQEVSCLLKHWTCAHHDHHAWLEFIQNPNQYTSTVEVWEPFEQVPGFDPHCDECHQLVIDALNFFSELSINGSLLWLKNNRAMLESKVGYPLSLNGVVSCVFYELGFTHKQAEMLFLILRLPGAAAHALEQEELGWRKFPFFGRDTILTDDPKASSSPGDQVESAKCENLSKRKR
ncbi:citryl-CoA lyase [Aliikangiella sp. IMCC44632]